MTIATDTINQFETTFQHLYNEAQLYADAERTQRALQKAIILLENGLEYKFNGKVLQFVSPDSGQNRIVTLFGCSTLCPCQNQYSYHQALYDLVKREFDTRRTHLSGLEMSAFFDSLPDGISDADAFDLWMTADREKDAKLKRIIADMDNAPYLKPETGKKPESYGNIRI